MHFETCTIKGCSKKSFYLFLCLNPQFLGRKWVQGGKIHFPLLFILWSKIEKRIENIENVV